MCVGSIGCFSLGIRDVFRFDKELTAKLTGLRKKKQFERSVVLESSEFDLSKFDCIYIQYVDGVKRI